MNSCFEEGEFIILIISLTQKSNKAIVSVKHGKITSVTILIL